MFPMTVTKRSGRADSSSGGKDYHLVMIVNADNRAILIQRWGKAKTWGTGWKCTEHASATDARAEFNKKFRDKFQGEYTETLVDKQIVCADEDELVKAIGPQYIDKIGKRIQFLIPGMDVSGLKDGEIDTEWEQQKDGSFKRKERERKTFEPVPEPVEDRIATNPSWGTWG